MNASSSKPEASNKSQVNAPPRPFYWSVRRELWENRSLYLAPLIVAVVQLIGFGVTTVGLAERRRALLLLADPIKQRIGIEQPYDVAAILMLLTTFIVAIFYCLDALYGERRDRSILFWKSLPVSDLTTVLSKVTIPLVVLPLLALVISICVQLIMVLMTGVVLLVHGMNPSTTLTHVPFLLNWFVLLYGLVALALWHAPIYGWFLLISGWVRRATFLWAVLPFLAISIFEKVTFGTSHFLALIKYRFGSFAAEAFDFQDQAHPTITSLSQLTPARFLTSPGLWLGLLFAVVCLAVTVRLRRYRGPI